MDTIIKQVHFDDKNEIIDNFRKEKVGSLRAALCLVSALFYR